VLDNQLSKYSIIKEIMEKDDIEYFIAGLKSVISGQWPSQEKFAEGVTSKVHLSNVLRGTSGTSLDMRRKLAAKAGFTIEDVIALGKRRLHPEADTVEDTAEPDSQAVAFSSDELIDMNSSDLLSKVSDYSSEIADQMMAHAKLVAGSAKALAEERNRLLKLFRREQAVSNSIGEAIKVVNKKYNIGYCNRAYSERYKQVEGDHCSKDNCISCRGACLAGKVFATGKPEQSLVEDNGSWFYKTAYPIPSPNGIIDAVVVVSREMDTLLELMREAGWECKFNGKA